jgi:hypothetical protein
MQAPVHIRVCGVMITVHQLASKFKPLCPVPTVAVGGDSALSGVWLSTRSGGQAVDRAGFWTSLHHRQTLPSRRRPRLFAWAWVEEACWDGVQSRNFIAIRESGRLVATEHLLVISHSMQVRLRLLPSTCAKEAVRLVVLLIRRHGTCSSINFLLKFRCLVGARQVPPAPLPYKLVP